ncbi:hypothetical protein K3495_g16952, partial [Podosphaera aphanis]
MNRTPSKKLGWKTPFECVHGYKPPLSHLDIIGSKVYALKKNIPRLDKLLARAHIGYLVGWESTNIYKVWVPSLAKVINTRDVLIDSGNIYDPEDLDVAALNQTADYDIVKALEWPSLVKDSPVQHEEDSIEDFINTTSSSIESEEKYSIDEEFKRPKQTEQFFQDHDSHRQILLPDGNSLPKGYEYVDETFRKTPSSQAMDDDRQLPG